MYHLYILWGEGQNIQIRTYRPQTIKCLCTIFTLPFFTSFSFQENQIMSDLMCFYMATAILQWIRHKYSSSGKYGIQWVSYLKRSALVLGDTTVCFHQYLELLRSEPTTQGICTYRLTEIISFCPLLTVIVAFINNSVILSSMGNLIVNSDCTWHEHLKFYACTSNYMSHCYSLTGLDESWMPVSVMNRNFVIVLDVFQTT